MFYSLLGSTRPKPLVTAPVSTGAVWYPGIYAKCEQTQQDSDGPTDTHFPSNYNGTGFTTSVYSELQRYTWFRGVQISLNWGDIETTGPTARNWAALDKKFEIIESLNKKIILMLTPKAFGVADATRILPSWLRQTGTQYVAGFPRYRRMWGFRSTNAQEGADPLGYHFRFADFRDGLSGNDLNGDPIYTLRNAYRDFLTAAYDRYKTSSAFSGFLPVEPIPLQAEDASELNRDQHFDGRLAWMKWLRGVVTDHMLIEACNHDNKYVTAMTSAGAANGCVANRLGYTGPNMHVGANLHGLYAAQANLAGIVPNVVQCQPQDMKDKKGFVVLPNTTSNPAPNDYYGWTEFPPAYGQPDVKFEQANPVVADPANGDWVIIRTQWLLGNFLVYQRNITTSNPFDWNDFVNYMENVTTLVSPNLTGTTAQRNIRNDPAGGLLIARPTYIV